MDQKLLEKAYSVEGKSMQDIAHLLNCSVHKVKYWMDKFKIQRRSLSEAIYLKNNPDGDPFLFNPPTSIKMAKLLGYGLGLYWGEGTKADRGSVRLGNANPSLIKKFMEFLIELFSVKREGFRFSLQVFSDIDVGYALDFWVKKLKIDRRQFYKTTVSISKTKGTYKKKFKYGVLTVYYHNKKFRDMLVSMLPK